MQQLSAPARRRHDGRRIRPPPAADVAQAAGAGRRTSTVGASPQKLFDTARGRLHRRPVRPRDHRLRRLHQELSEVRQADDAQVNIGNVVPRRRQERQGGRSVRPRDPHLSDGRHDSRGVLPEGARAQHAQGRRPARATRSKTSSRTIPTAATPTLAKQRLDAEARSSSTRRTGAARRARTLVACVAGRTMSLSIADCALHVPEGTLWAA